MGRVGLRRLGWWRRRRRNKCYRDCCDLGFVETHPSVLSLMFLVKIANGQMQILRLTTPKLKNVWGPVRSE